MSTAYALTPESTSWRPRTPRVALQALRKEWTTEDNEKRIGVVPFDFLELDRVEQAFLRTLNRQGTVEDLDVLLAHVGYTDTKYTLQDHHLAMTIAVGQMTEEITVCPPVPGRKGRPSNTSPHRGIDWDWGVVLNWLLRWAFRKALDSTDVTLKPELTFDPLNPALPWLNETDERPLREGTYKLAHTAKWAEWHYNPAMKEAVALRNEHPRSKHKGKLVNPDPSRRMKDAIAQDVQQRASMFPQIPYGTASQPRRPWPDHHPENPPHPDNKRWVANWRKERMNALEALKTEMREQHDEQMRALSRIELRQLDEAERREPLLDQEDAETA